MNFDVPAGEAWGRCVLTMYSGKPHGTMHVSAGGMGNMSDELTVLELLVTEAAPGQFESLVTEARRSGSGARVANVERAKQLGLEIRSLLERRQQREASLAALVDAARDLAVPDDLDTLLVLATRRTRLLLNADMAYVSLPDESRGDVVIRAADGHTSTLSVGLRLPRTGGMGSTVLADPSPFWSPDYLADERFPHDELIDEVVRTEGLRAVMAVPLTFGTETFGVLYAADRSVRHFKVDEISLMSALGGLVGVTIDRAVRFGKAAEETAGFRRSIAAAEAGLAGLGEVNAIHRRLIDDVLGGSDLSGLADKASALLDSAVRITAADGGILAASGGMPEERESALSATVDAHVARETVQLPDGRWAAPVFAGEEYLGTLLVRPNDVFTDRDRQLLLVVAQAAGVRLLLDSKAVVADSDTRSDLLDDLLASTPRPLRQLKRRARRLGVDLDVAHVIVVVRGDGSSRGKGVVWAASYAHRMGGLSTTKDGDSVLLLRGTDAGAAARAALSQLKSLLAPPMTVSGAGPVSDAGSVRHRFLEAVRCLDAMAVIGATGRAASASELGFLGVLLSDSPDVDGFIGTTIGPVIDYDRQRSTELCRTLEAYFETGGSPTHSAQRLHVHANTVARRLDRVGELLGPGWQSPGRALDIQLALRLSRLRHHFEGSGPGHDT
ncbi:GAF domain-containing protein [Amycolatopsis sp. NPDC021455]|uniref:helix-turn-helix domain-containing protein n=1 Tax=Amycolatopsis sp. NPDC021455 TaxID=3154901 RepID=UPI0033F996F1